jgi:peptide/nickel transport system permease protein
MLIRMPTALAGIIIISFFLFIAFFGPLISPYGPYAISENMFQPPSYEHPFGTDELGRDLLSRILNGARYSLQSGVFVLVLSALVGTVVGSVAGYFGGKVDELLMRITDVFLAFPSIIMAIAICSALGPNLTNAMIALGITWWPWYARQIRAQVLSVINMPYIEAAKAYGKRGLRIITDHVIPNSFSPILVYMTLDLGYLIITTAALSFLGFGAQPPLPEWGRLITDGRTWFPRVWWLTLIPGIFIFLVGLGFNLFGDGLRDVMDPRLRRQFEGKGNER